MAQHCSTLSRAVDEPMIGTAPVAGGWVLVEQPGPWGRDALTQSRLDVDAARRLAERARQVGVRPGLIRRHGRHAVEPTRSVLLASTIPGASWLARLRITSPAALEEVDVQALAAGEPPAEAELLTEPVLAVCTNGRRDVCCATNGRRVAAALSVEHPGRVWETSHLGGHRFAATAVLLPHGLVYGRLDPGSALALLREADAGRMPLDGLRGRSTWSRAGQVAEAEVRRRTAARALDAVVAVSEQPAEDGSWLCTVTEASGGRWTVRVRPTPAAAVRPSSCGAEPEPLQTLRADPPVTA